ncbi:MAG: hypothetical protein QW338_02725 [Conexivisphaerales archaeon]
MKDEYLYTGHEPKVAGAGLTRRSTLRMMVIRNYNLSETVRRTGEKFVSN